jgi:outer membrane lipoprotein-sorting protein
MKKLLFGILCVFPVFLVDAQDIKIDDLISKHLKLMGQEKMANIQTIKMTGKMIQGETEVAITSYDKRPSFMRQEMDVQGTKVIIVSDGENGWMINPLIGSSDPQVLSPDVLNGIKKQIQSSPFGNWNNPFVRWKENGATIENVGTEDMNGTKVYNVKVTFKDGAIVNYYMDIGKYMILRTRFKLSMEGETLDVESNFSDFRDVNGILFPFRTENFSNGQPGSVFIINNYEFNTVISDSIFIKPVTLTK